MINAIINNFTGSNPSRDNIERINGNDHIFNITLDNGTTQVRLKFAAIDSLTIVDDLRYFYVYGKCTFSYNQDALESFEGFGGSEPGTSSQMFEPFKFRGDGRDTIEIEIMPQMRDSDCLEIGADEAEREKYCIKYLCSIHHYEDATDGMGFKRRTLYFWDQHFQYLNNLQTDFSTDMLVKEYERESINVNSGDVNIKTSTSNNGVYTGDAIRGFLEYTLGETYGVEVKFDDAEWDIGAAKTTYTAPAQYRAIDDLDFLVLYHVAGDDYKNLPCILRKKRYTEEYQLIPINRFYEEDFQTSSSIMDGIGGISTKTEDFFIGKLNTGDGDALNSNISKGIATEYTVIDNYNFVKISAKELQEYFTTYVVHTTDPRGNFRTDIKPNNYESLKEMYDEIFVQPNRPPQGGAPISNLADNLIRQQNKNAKHVFVPSVINEKQRRSFGVNRTMLNMFFKNTSITFNARGNTARQSGKLITINRRNNDVQPTHDSNLLGQYLITYLRHEFTGGTYANLIQATKPYTTMDPEFAILP